MLPRGTVMAFFSWFRRRRNVAGDGGPASPDPAGRQQAWSANQISDLLQVARPLVSAPRVRALDEAFRRSDGDTLRRELAFLLDKAVQYLGPEHTDTATVLEQLGRCGRDPAETAKHLVPCLAIRTRALGPSHPDTARAQYFLGFSYQNLRQYDRAIPLLEQSLGTIDAGGPAASYWLPQVLSSLGISYGQTQQFEKAERAGLRCLEWAETTAEKDPAHVEAALTNLGTLYGQYGHLDRAEACLSRAADLVQNDPGLRWESLAGALQALAAALAQAGQRDRAEAVYLRFARICMAHSTIPPPRPWAGESGGMMTLMLQLAGCPEDVRKRVAANEDLMTSHMLKMLRPGTQEEKKEDPPKGRAEPTAEPDPGS